MKTADGAIARLPVAEPEIGIDTLYRPFLRRWRLVGTLVALSCAAALALILLPRREYRSQLVLAAVPNAKASSIAGGISSLLGNAQMGGVQSTPYFITRLLMLRGVLREVAQSPVGSGEAGQRTVIERVLERPAAQIRPAEVEAAMRSLVSTDVDKQTGLVTLSVTHADSALTRHVAEELVAAAGRTFVKVLRSQASEQRESGQAKVDSARRELQRAEGRLQEFQTTHRVYAAYSNAAVERQRIDRELASAQAAYQSAVDDRQGAIARELEESPAVVVVDPIPADLVPEPRQAVLKLVLAAALGLVAATIVLVLSGEFARPAASEEGRAGARAAA